MFFFACRFRHGTCCASAFVILSSIWTAGCASSSGRLVRLESAAGSSSGASARESSAVLTAFEASDEEDQCARLAEASQCQKTDGCMWHLAACRRQPQKNKRCFAGSSYVDCLDVAACANNGPSGPSAEHRWAFVYTHSAPQDLDAEEYEMNIAALRDAAEEYTNTDIVLLVPKEGSAIDCMGGTAHKLRPEAATKLRELGVIVRTVDWAIPPEMQFRPKVPWCGSKDFLRLQVMGLSGYASIVYMDFDVQLRDAKAASQLFRCAAAGDGRIIWTPDVIGPINIGVFAVRPHPGILQAGALLARSINYTRLTGWGNAGFAPAREPFIGAECGQGFFLLMFFSQDFPPVADAARRANVVLPKAEQVDVCRWNYLHGWECPSSFSCHDVVFMHKASFDAGGCKQKQKLGYFLHARSKDPSSASAVLRQLAQIRRMSWQAPIYIASDGGLNFSEVCANSWARPCEFSWHPHSNDLHNPKPLLDRFRRAVEWLESEYVLYLEPEVQVKRHIQGYPGADAGGLQNALSEPMPRPLQEHLEELGRSATGHKHFRLPEGGRVALTAGSVLRSQAALRSFRDAAHTVDWKRLEELGGQRVYTSDLALVSALAAHGFTYEPWDELQSASSSALLEGALLLQSSSDGSAKADADTWMVEKLAELGKLVKTPTINVEAIQCRGCVWGEDADCLPNSGRKSCPTSPVPAPPADA
eukprot:TRINITY_DN26521_c0_g1_i1.p1 TRINITY_DN26521_c0_g1~~TRINITY_DN26521_c0_g1_i1.p1  ORF type:complete len:702 (-),score=144.03 TRINITY_DN26521_c0_g1_i1:142-2247(-)